MSDRNDSQFERAREKTTTWSVWRQDDHGRKFRISGGHTEAEARELARNFESRGHKQMYWAEAEDGSGN